MRIERIAGALAILFVIIAIVSHEWHQREVFVVAPGFSGGVVALYGQSTSTPSVKRWLTTTYQVASDGVVRTPNMEPERWTTIKVVAGPKHRELHQYNDCDDMRLNHSHKKNDLAVCWFGYFGGTNSPENIAFVVSDWDRLPLAYERASYMVDSLVFRLSKPGARKWVEPNR